jgi:DNA-binding XRE family transcriptional regulator
MKTKSTTQLNDYMSDVTNEERKFIDQEKKYYEVVAALRNKRQELGLSQDELAKKAHVPRTTITKVESGNRNATLRTLMSLAEAMGTTFEVRLR